MKWAGGKTQMLDALLERVPPAIDSYYEPLAGGAALFFALAADPDRKPRRAVLNDLNGELMTAFEVVRDHPEELIERLAALQQRYLAASEGDGRAELFYGVRGEQSSEPLEVAARLIFLNKTCFNGLYRVNRAGRFNVPHGRYPKPRIADGDAILAASSALRETELRAVDFEAACEDARPGDFVYLDPPFHPMSATSSFTAYTGAAFGRDEQLRLKWCLDGLTERGVPAMLSNSPHPWVVGMYEGGRYRLQEVPARRVINSRGDRRTGISELLITNYDPPDGPAA